MSVESPSSKIRDVLDFRFVAFHYSTSTLHPEPGLKHPDVTHLNSKPLLPLCLPLTNTDPCCSRGCWLGPHTRTVELDPNIYNSAWLLETEMLSVSGTLPNSKQVFVQSLIFLFSFAGHTLSSFQN